MSRRVCAMFIDRSGRTIKIALCLLLAAAFLSGAVNMPVHASSIDVSTETDTSVQASAASATSSYYDYYKQNTGSAYAKTDMTLAMRDAILSAQKTKVLPDYQGEGPVVQIDYEGFAEWHFEIPEDSIYHINIRYVSVSGNHRNPRIGFLLDGEIPFAGADNVELKKIWKDAAGAAVDKRGNDLIPKQEEVLAFQSVDLTDYSGFLSGAYSVFFSKGSHTLRFFVPDEPVIISLVTLTAGEDIRNYEEILGQYTTDDLNTPADVYLEYQAEKTTQKSDQTIYPVYDRTNAATVPSDPEKIRRNVIGQNNWSKPGMWISYTVDNIPEDGLYMLSFKYRQNYQLGMSTYRTLYINGEIPFEEMSDIAFPFGFIWQNMTISDKNGTPCYVYLKKGANTIRIESTIGRWSEVFSEVSETLADLNDVYRRIIIVTGTSPDLYRDYKLEDEIIGLQDTLKELSDRLAGLADRFDTINGSKSSQSEPLRRASEQLAAFTLRTSEIPKRLIKFRENIAMLSTWLLGNVEQPLEIDYFMIHSIDAQLPSPKGGFWSNLQFDFLRFIAAFKSDYNSMSDYDTQTAISIWSAEGRDQVQILKDMITDGFTADTGIQVNLNLVQSGFVEATLSGNGPDIAIGAARGQPVNLASRGALADLSVFPAYEEVQRRFAPGAQIPYRYKDGIYALPLTQTFQMMFYRTDIFEELDLEVPQTWTEVFDVTAVLQRKNMTMGLPYTSITAQGAVDLGVGAKDIYPTLLMQYGGAFYTKDLTATALDTRAALDAFKVWTSFYTKYGFELSYDFNTRFRSGEMPLAIASFGMYGVLAAAAPEIRNQWAMVPVPGILDGDTVNRAGGASGSAVILFKDAEDKNSCWKFMEWFTRTQTQAAFGNSVESLLGAAARYPTANVEAFDLLNWSKSEREVLNAQRLEIVEVPEVPGSYFLSRCLDNAFRDVLFSSTNPRVALERENISINRELARKQLELGR
ncbi:MAG: extracellular solute-binding protein [Saccharofermentanales bacterium]